MTRRLRDDQEVCQKAEPNGSIGFIKIEKIYHAGYVLPNATPVLRRRTLLLRRRQRLPACMLSIYIHTYMCTCVYIYMYMHVYVYIWRERDYKVAIGKAHPGDCE